VTIANNVIMKRLQGTYDLVGHTAVNFACKKLCSSTVYSIRLSFRNIFKIRECAD